MTKRQEAVLTMGEKESSLWHTLGRVVATLAIWLALSLVAAAIVAVVPNVNPCIRSGVKGCRDAIVAGFAFQTPDTPVAWNTPGAMEWLILVVSLIVAVRIMYPPDDLSTPPEKQA